MFCRQEICFKVDFNDIAVMHNDEKGRVGHARVWEDNREHNLFVQQWDPKMDPNPEESSLDSILNLRRDPNL